MKTTPLAQCLRAVLALACGILVLTSGLLASEQLTTAGALNILRKDHTATVLTDGRVLILGGQNDAGELASAEIYDPATKSFSPAGMMSVARLGHTATLLADGQVLAAGGRNSSGPLTTAEIFDPTSLTFRTVDAAMGAARVHHTATRLVSGKVLLAGGDFVGTAELFDPATQTFSSPLISMIEPRSGQTATTLPESSVLLAGGGTRSVEVFDIQTSEFLTWPSMLNEIRSGQSAIATPDTNLYFVGGEDFGTLEKFDLLGSGSTTSLSLGAPSSSATLLANGKVLVTGPALASLFNPTTNALSTIDNSALLQRSGQTMTELPADKEILVVGGIDANTTLVGAAALYNPARIETDKADYYPDEPVIVYGSGWKPGESVDLYVVDDLGWIYDSTATADADGAFTADPYFVVLMRHLGVTFDLTAVGAQSGLQAKHTFTDGNKVDVSVGTQSGSAVPGSGGIVSFVVTGVRDNANNATSSTLTFSITGLPGGLVTANFAPSFSVNPLTFPSSSPNASRTSTLTLTVPDTLAAGSYPFTVTPTGGGNTGSGTLIVKATPTITWNDPAAITYGTALQATQLNASANVPGTFTYTPAAGTVLNAGANQTLHVDFTPTDTVHYSAASKDVSITVDRANATISVTPYNVTYDGDAHTATGTAKGVNNEALTGLDLSGTTHTNAGTYGSDAWTFTDVTGNYNNANGTVSDSIAKANATISVTPYSVTYDGDAHTATGTAKGVKNEALAGLDLSGTTHTNAGTFASDAWTFTDVTGNYNNTNGTVSDSIAKANATISVTPYSVMYDGDAHTATGTAKGVKNEALSGLDVSATTHTSAGSYSSDAWTFTDATGNYNNAAGTVSDSIAKANATISVTPYSVTYDGAAHTATGTAKGVKGEALAGLDLSATTHTNAGTYANDTWTFTDATGNYNNANSIVSDNIAKASATIIVTPYNVTYDGHAHTATGTAAGVKNEALVGLDLSGTTHTGAGTYTSDAWTFTDATGNYNNANGTVSNSIAKANATINVTPYSVTYDGAAHTAIGFATGVNGESLTGLDLSGTTHTDAGSYNDSWSFTDSTGNYNDKTSGVTDAIAKANASIVVNGYSGVYDGAAHGATGSATGVGSVDLSASLDLGTKFTNAPGGTAHWSFAGGANYNDASGSAAIVIEQATATIHVTGYDVTYDANVHTATGTATGVNGENLTSQLDLSATAHSDAGTYSDGWSFAGGTNYKDAAGTTSDVIHKADALISVSGYSDIYDGLAHGATGTATGVGDTDLSSLLNLGNTFTNVPGGTANWSFAGNANYNAASGSVAIDILAKPASVTPQADTKVYGESDPAFTGTLSGFLAGDNVTATYSRTSGENVAGSPYTISAVLSPSGVLGNYAITYHTAEFTITPATLAVAAAHQTKVYGEADPTLTYSSSGFQFSDTALTVLSGSLTRAAGENVGSYAIAQGTLVANENYTIAFTGENLVITVRPVSIAAEAKTKVYGEADPVLTFQFTNSTHLAFSDAFAGGLSRAAGESVGNYAIGQGTLSLSSNYSLTFTGANFEITHRSVAVKADNQTKIYGAVDPALTYQVTSGSLAFDDGFAGALTRAAGETVGNYAISQGTLSLNSNYTLSFTAGTLEIQKKAASVVIDAKTKVYGDADPALTGTLSGFLSADGVSATYARVAGETVAGGPYAISATLSPSSVLTNYDISTTPASLSITARPASVTPDAANKVFGAPDPTFTGTLTGFLPADNVTATYSRTAGETVAGSPYTISATLSPAAVLTNYNITYKTAQFTINYWNWTGFFQPVDNLPVVNRVKAGSAVPIKFSLKGNKGLSIIAAGYPGVNYIPTNDAAVVSVIDQTITAGNSSLSYDATSDQYIYVWKTDKAWAGTSYRFVLKLTDGSYHYADFNFTK